MRYLNCHLTENSQLTVDLIIKGGNIVLHDTIVEGAIAIDNGKIQKIGKESTLTQAEKTINLQGELVFPGIIDIHVHLRDLELSYKEDFTTGTQAAIVGGVSALLDMPNTKPLTNSLISLKHKKEVAKKKLLCDAGFYSLLPNNLQEIDEIINEGVIGFKIFPHQPYTNLPLTLMNLKNVFSQINGRVPLAIHPDLSTNGGSDITKFLTKYSSHLEAKAIKWIGSILTKIDRLHICHVSAREALLEVYRLREEGFNVTCEVTPHHLLMTQETLFSKQGIAKMLPPLRTITDIQTMQTALTQEKINAIATDHAPHTLNEKSGPFSQVPSGIPGLETLLPIMVDYALKKNFPLYKLGRLLSENPAKIYGIPNKGGLVPGYDADIVIIDPTKTRHIDVSQFWSKAKFSPFEGYVVKGIPVMTIIRGIVAVINDEIQISPGFGKLLTGSKREYH